VHERGTLFERETEPLKNKGITMARGRFLSTSVAEDDRLSRLSLTAELLYLKTIPHLDRDGMISGRAGYLWGRVCPLREELMLEMQGAINEWVTVGLVVRLDTDIGPVLFFPGFLKNNNLLHYDRESPSRFPVPPGYERTEMGLIPEGAEQKKKPTRKPKMEQVPPNSNGNYPLVNDVVNELVIDFASKGEVEVKDQVKEEAETPPAAAAVTSPDTARLWVKWDANMPGTKTPVIVDSVNGLLDDYAIAEIEEAITIACKRNIRTFSYVQGILAKGALRSPPTPNGGDYAPQRSGNRGFNAASDYMREKGMFNERH
jgi:hypothetical protein